MSAERPHEIATAQFIGENPTYARLDRPKLLAGDFNTLMGTLYRVVLPEIKDESSPYAAIAIVPEAFTPQEYLFMKRMINIVVRQELWMFGEIKNGRDGNFLLGRHTHTSAIEEDRKIVEETISMRNKVRELITGTDDSNVLTKYPAVRKRLVEALLFIRDVVHTGLKNSRLTTSNAFLALADHPMMIATLLEATTLTPEPIGRNTDRSSPWYGLNDVTPAEFGHKNITTQTGAPAASETRGSGRMRPERPRKTQQIPRPRRGVPPQNPPTPQETEQ